MAAEREAREAEARAGSAKLEKTRAAESLFDVSVGQVSDACFIPMLKF